MSLHMIRGESVLWLSKSTWGALGENIRLIWEHLWGLWTESNLPTAIRTVEEVHCAPNVRNRRSHGDFKWCKNTKIRRKDSDITSPKDKILAAILKILCRVLLTDLFSQILCWIDWIFSVTVVIFCTSFCTFFDSKYLSMPHLIINWEKEKNKDTESRRDRKTKTGWRDTRHSDFNITRRERWAGGRGVWGSRWKGGEEERRCRSRGRRKTITRENKTRRFQLRVKLLS